MVDPRGALAFTRVGEDSWLTSSEAVDHPLTKVQTWSYLSFPARRTAAAVVDRGGAQR